MSRLASQLAVGSLVVGMLAVAGPVSAQHDDYHPSGGYYSGSSGGHYHVVPGHLHRHGNHYDYHPGGIIYHPNSTPSYSPPRTTYIQPGYGSSTYGSGYGSGYGSSYDGHPYEHQSQGHTTGYRGTFGGFSHIDDLAVQLEEQANLMCLEMHYNYQHNPGYRETYREAYEILTTAKYIHGLEHAGNRDRIRQAVLELDPLFHHVQEDVRHWTRHDHRPLGGGSLKMKMVAVEEALHHLMNDVGATSEYGNPAAETAPPASGYNDRQGPLIGR